MTDPLVIDTRFNLHNTHTFFKEKKMQNEEKEPDYKKGFDVLMQHWEHLPDDVKEEVDATLKELGL